MSAYTYQAGRQCIYKVTASDLLSRLDIMHENCLSKMRDCQEKNDKVKFWSLAQVDIRILKAKLNTISSRVE